MIQGFLRKGGPSLDGKHLKFPAPAEGSKFCYSCAEAPGSSHGLARLRRPGSRHRAAVRRALSNPVADDPLSASPGPVHPAPAGGARLGGVDTCPSDGPSQHAAPAALAAAVASGSCRTALRRISPGRRATLAGRRQGELELDGDGVRLRHLVFGRGASRRYAKGDVGGVFVSDTREPHPWVAWYAPGTLLRRPRFGPSAFESFTRGHIAVELAATAAPFPGTRRGPAGAYTVHFGSLLESDEADRIVSMIHRRFPNYALRS